MQIAITIDEFPWCAYNEKHYKRINGCSTSRANNTETLQMHDIDWRLPTISTTANVATMGKA